MRIAAVLATMMALLCIARDAEAACKRGKLLFRIESSPLAVDDRDPEVLEVRTTGRWTRTGADAGTGCLSKKQLALVSKAVKRARFEYPQGMSTCEAVNSRALVYSGARGRIETEAPCGRAIDAGTDSAARCVTAALSPASKGTSLADSCAAPPPLTCKPGTPLFRVTTTPFSSELETGVLSEVVEVRSKGAWSRSEAGAEIARGCLGDDRLALVKRAVKRAKFKKSQPAMTCKAMSTVEITYQGARKRQRVTIAAPCGEAIDDGTRLAAECVAAVTSGSRPDTVSLQCDRAED